VWVVRSASFTLAAGVAAGSVLAGFHIAFGESPIGGTAGLSALYVTTVAVGLGLAALFQLRSVANRLVATSSPGGAKVIRLLPPANADRRRAEWRRLPFNAA
jgi:hypothetical protein